MNDIDSSRQVTGTRALEAVASAGADGGCRALAPRVVAVAVWLAMGVVAACTAAHEPSAPEPAAGRSEFLRACGSGCAPPLRCMCGVCTLPCTDDDVCLLVARGASCLPASPECGAACGLECAADGDCTALGAGFACEAGRCRLAETGGPPDGSSSGSGAGGSAGAAGASPPPADSGTAPGDAGAAAALCDGSDEIRLGAWSSAGFGGPVPPGLPIPFSIYEFMSPYGHDFLFVNGRCEYHARRLRQFAVVRGTLTAEEADLLVAETSWSRWQEWSGYNAPLCPDGVAGPWIAGAGDRGASFPECPPGDPGAPEGLEQAIEGARAWAQRLGQQGAPPSGPLAAVAYEITDGVAASWPPWPLERPLASVPGLVHAQYQEPSPVVLTEPTETAQLRALRAPYEGAMSTDSTDPVGVVDAGRAYKLYMRDELPGDWTARIEAFMARAFPSE